ncbi:MAG: Ig-like domain-containing protein [Thermoplasmata archaeon]
MNNRLNYTNRAYWCISAVIVVLLLFSAMPITTHTQGTDAGAAEKNSNAFSTKTKTRETPSQKILFVFDDNAGILGTGAIYTVWLDTIIKSMEASGKILNRTDLQTDAFFVWDQDEDFISGVKTADQATFDKKANGPAYSGGTYQKVYNSETKQQEDHNFDMKNYDAVVWLTGLDSGGIDIDQDQTPDGITLTSTDIANLKQYLTNGGKLWLCGQDILLDVYGQTDEDGDQFPDMTETKQGDLFFDFFKIATAFQDFGTPDTLTGTAKGLTGGASYQTSALSSGIEEDDGDYRVYGDFIYSPLASPQYNRLTEVFNSTPSATQQQNGWPSADLPYYLNAYQYDNRPYGSSPYKVVFFSFEFASISNENQRIDLMDKVLRYLITRPPIITVTAPTEGQNIAGTFSITGTSSDPDGTVTKIYLVIDNQTSTPLATLTSNLNSWSYSFDTTKYQDGSHQLAAIAEDDTGQMTACFVNFTINQAGGTSHAPSVTVTSPGEGDTTGGTTTISGTASDPDGNVQKVQVRLGGGEWQDATGTTSWTFSADVSPYASLGPLKIDVRAYNGMYSPVVSRNITINLNNHAPAVVVTAPTEGQTISGTFTIRGAATDADSLSQIRWVQIKVDSESYNKNASKDGGSWASWMCSLDTTSYTAGSHKISVKAFDGIAESTEYVVNVTIQSGSTNAPTARITASTQSVDIGVSVTLDGTTSSGSSQSATLTYTWSIDSQSSGSSVSLSTTTTSTTTMTPTHAGIYKIKLVVREGSQDSTPAFIDITVTTPSGPKPDISVLNITFKKGSLAVTSAGVDDTITIYASIKNIGSTNASNIEVMFYNGDPSAGGIQIGTMQKITSLAISGTSTVSVSQKFTALGTFTIFVIADKNSKIIESKEDNNVLSRALVVSSVSPDSKFPNLKIDIKDVSFSTENGDPLGFVAEGDKIKIIAKVYNTKGEEFTGGVSVKFYAGGVSQDNLIKSYDEISTISKNSYQEASCTWETIEGAPIEIYVVVESGTDESNPADNIAHKPIFILDASMLGVGSVTTASPTPGFEICALFVAIGFAFIIKKRRENKK